MKFLNPFLLVNHYKAERKEPTYGVKQRLSLVM